MNFRLQNAFNSFLIRNPGASSSLTALRATMDSRQVVAQREDRYLPPLPTPLLLDADQARFLDHASERIVSLLTTQMARLLGTEEAARRELRLPRQLERYVYAPLDNLVPIARCDYLWSRRGWQLVEVNFGGACGGMDIGEYNEVARSEPLIAGFLDEHGLDAPTPMTALADRIKLACRGITSAAEPVLAVVDSPGYDRIYGIAHERVARQYAERGLRTVICNLNELTQRDGRLLLGDLWVHAVHRDFLLEDLIEVPDAAITVLVAAQRGNLVLVSGFYDEMLGAKAVLALLRGAAARGDLPVKDTALVRKVLPETTLVHRPQDPALAGWYDPSRNGTGDDGWVLKPSFGSSGQSVVLGPTVGPRSFDEAVSRAASSAEAWVCQRYVESTPVVLPILADDRLSLAECQIHPSILVLDGRAVGAWTRAVVGRDPCVIGVLRGALCGGVLFGGADVPLREP
jgi:hypothetical protein